MKAIGDEITIIEEDHHKKNKRDIEKLMKPIIEAYGKGGLDEAINEGTMQILSNPQYRGLLKSIAESAVCVAAVKYWTKL